MFTDIEETQPDPHLGILGSKTSKKHSPVHSFFDAFEQFDSKNAVYLGKKVGPEFPNVDHTVFFPKFLEHFD